MKIKPKQIKVSHKSKNRPPLHQLHRRDRNGKLTGKAGYNMDSGFNAEAAGQDELDRSISRDGTDPLSLEARFDEQGRPQVPELYTTAPPIRDNLTTDTSVSQGDVVKQCLPRLIACSRSLAGVNPYGIPSLEREDHIRFTQDAIDYARYIAYDPVRPWVIYWSLTALSLLGEHVELYQPRYAFLKSTSYHLRLAYQLIRVVETLSPCQNLGGGFGGGHGQLSHVATSYAVVLSLAMAGGGENMDMLDRRAL